VKCSSLDNFKSPPATEREMGGHTLSKTQIGILGGALKRGLFRDYISRDLNSAKSCNCQESCKLSYGMGVGKRRLG
jgi:hypothetical protein